MTPPKLIVDDQGRVHGANVTWNQPFPCPNGDDKEMTVPKGIFGFVLHTQVGNNPGTIETFNNPHLAKPRSAHFCVAQDGSIVQMGPVNGWKAWSQVDGNRQYFSAEFADDKKNPPPALTQEQVNAGAQLLELLSRDTVGRFPMQISDRPGDEGFGWHGMGGKSWGNHPDCPGETRKAQRPAIIELAQAIRAGGELAVYICEGHKSLAGLAAQLHSAPSTLLRLTAEHSPGRRFYSGMAGYLNEVFAADKENVPKDTIVYYLAHPTDPTPKPFPSHGDQTLQGLANAFGCKPADIVQYTAENSPGELFSGDMAKYLNDVFKNSTTHVPSGAHLFYEK
jgi:hypothetical protein